MNPGLVAGASLIEVSQHWGESLLRVERFAGTRRLSVGPGAADFQAPLAGRVTLVDRGAVLVPGAAPLVIAADTDVRIALGNQTFRVRAVEPERAVPRELLRRLDWFFIAVCAGTAAFAALVTLAAVVIWLMLKALVVLIMLIALWLSVPPPSIPWLIPPPALAEVRPPDRVIAVDLAPSAAPLAPPAPVFFERPTPRPTLTPIPMGDILTKEVRVAKRVRPREEEVVEMVAVLGVLKADDSARLSSIFGSGIEGGVEGGVVMGGLIGSGDGGGEGYGVGGLGVRGSGGGGTGTGVAGIGGIGTIERKTSAGVRLGADSDVDGDALPPEVIKRVMQRHLPQIRYCYEREIDDDEELSGKISIAFSIDGDGSVSEARVSSSTMDNEAVQSCLVGRVLHMTFPAPRGGETVRVVYPFSFQQI